MQLRGAYAFFLPGYDRLLLSYTCRGLVRALGASSTGSGSKPALGRFSQAQQGTANSDESTAKHLLGKFSLGHHAKQCNTTAGSESTGRYSEEPEKRHFWRGKHAEKDAL